MDCVKAGWLVKRKRMWTPSRSAAPPHGCFVLALDGVRIFHVRIFEGLGIDEDIVGRVRRILVAENFEDRRIALSPLRSAVN